MNRALLWPAALLALAAFAAPALAQYIPTGQPLTPPAGQPSGIGFVQEVKTADAPAADMQEEIEIMRRLLDGAFAEAYGFSVHLPPTSPIRNYPMIGPAQLSDDGRLTFAHHVDATATHTEGVYLKDYGVVYTVTLPLPPFSVLPGPSSGGGAKTPPDAWDRIRKEIHGETPTPEGKAVPGHTPLSETILKVLADNGKHFGALADGERISVAVTFRGTANCASCHEIPWNKGQPGLPPYNFYGEQTSTGGNPPSGPVAASTQSQTPETPAWQTDVRNAILLGDLHMKQGKTEDAIKAYQKALNQLEQMLPHKAGSVLTRDDVPVLITGEQLCIKLAAALHETGQQDAATSELKQALELDQRVKQLTGAPVTANPTPAASPLPAKLVVTVSKKLLDDVGSGRMTFEAFCKAAMVEYVNPAAEKK